jgi:hypothetical protein
MPVGSLEANSIAYNFWNIYDIYQDEPNDIQKNSQNMNLIGDQRRALTPCSELDGVKENNLNLYFFHSNNDSPQKLVSIDEGNTITEPVPSPTKRIEDAHQPKSAFDRSHDRSLPFPAFPFATIDVSGDSPVESVATPSLQPHQQIAQLVEHLVLRREESAVHLRLDPPELGSVEIRIQVEGNAVHAWLAAERDLTRQSLEQQAQQLREQLASRGLQLAHFEVNAGSQEAFARARYAPLPSLPYSESRPRPQAAMESAYLFGQWSVWA